MPLADLPPLTKLDPEEAWKPWQPDAQNPWNRKWAAHLLRRAAFGAPPYALDTSTWEGLQRVVRQGLEATLTELFEGAAGREEYDRLMDGLAPDATLDRLGRPPETLLEDIQAWWLGRMAHSPFPLRERLTLFWHNHFATSIAKVRQSSLMVKQNQLIRTHALGKFGPFLLEMSKDPAMLVWLDSNTNVKGKPNENYARELMELFSLGVGHYTEQDIQEAARAFTGWHTSGTAFNFVAFQHDDGEKTFLGRQGNWDGGDVVRMVLEQPACARFLARKLYREFISEAETPPDALLEPLAEGLRTSGYDIGQAVRTMLQSRLFFSSHAYRRKIKSPVDYVIGLVRALDGNPTPSALAAAVRGLGQELFAPPNVKGWDGGRTWLNTATLLGRHNRAWALLTGTTIASPPPRPGFPPSAGQAIRLDPAALVKRQAVQEPARQVGFLLDLFLQGDVAPDARQKLVDYFEAGAATEAERTLRLREVAHTLLLLPEYQLA